MANAVLNRAKFGWNKWFGANSELLKNDDPYWTCQACAKERPADIPCFMYEIFQEEYIKICTFCYKIQHDEHILDVNVLIARVRH